MENQDKDPDFSEADYAKYLITIAEIRQKAFKQIIYGFCWWSASAIAMYFAMQSTNSSVYWYGGALGALFHWYRAFKLISATRKFGAKALIQNEIILIGVVALVVFVSGSKIIPEYFRIDTPTLGTCWAETDSGSYAPVACWSSNASIKSSYYSDTDTGCGLAGYFEPTSTEDQFICLEEL